MNKRVDSESSVTKIQYTLHSFLDVLIRVQINNLYMILGFPK